MKIGKECDKSPRSVDLDALCRYKLVAETLLTVTKRLQDEG